MYRDLRKKQSLKKQGLLYMHIPKTAGSSINNLIVSQFDKDKVATHIESKKLLGTIDSDEIAKKYCYLSGHMIYPQLQIGLNLNNWVTFSTFRRPDEHVVSHLAWVRLLAEDGQKSRLRQHNTTIQEIANFMKNLNFSDSNDVKGMILWLEKKNYYLFHNTQTHYLCGGKVEPTVVPPLLNNALKNLELLDFVGITERLEEFKLMLMAILGFTGVLSLEKKQNTNNNKYGMDLTNKEFRKAIQPLIAYDHIIYAAARRKFIDSLHRFLADLEKSQNPRVSTVNINVLRQIIVDGG